MHQNQSTSDATTHMPAHDPTTHYTDGQWYCYQARQSVYFSAFSKASLSAKDLQSFTADLLANAPQVTVGFKKSKNGALDPELLSQMIERVEVDDLDAYPDAWDTSADPLYERPDLPMMRIRAAVRKDGPDAQGRYASLQMLSTHALFEGADSALLSRSQEAGHAEENIQVVKRPLWKRIYLRLSAAIFAPIQIVLAFFLASKENTHDFAALAFSRDRIRKAAARYGVGQRAFMFALVTMAINGHQKILSKGRISATYTVLDGTHKLRTNDDFFRFRLMEVIFPVHDDFETFAKAIEKSLLNIETKKPLYSQAFINALFHAHRWIKTNLPFLYFKRLFRFTGFYHFNLSITPPHRLQGELVSNLMEPVYGGTQHPGLNSCIFIPQRNWITFNFDLPARLIGRVPEVTKLFDELDKMTEIKDPKSSST